MQNCTKLEHIELSAEELSQSAFLFQDRARQLKNKLWWKEMKIKLTILGAFLVVLALIVGLSVALRAN